MLPRKTQMQKIKMIRISNFLYGKIKYLRTVILSICLLAASTNLALATHVELDDKIKQWKPGELIAVVSICKDEQTILRVARADTISEEKVLSLIHELNTIELCLSFPQPILFTIKSLLIEYKDFNGIDSLVLGVNGSGDNFLGWVLVSGIFIEGLGI
jgi:hypothetical protein